MTPSAPTYTYTSILMLLVLSVSACSKKTPPKSNASTDAGRKTSSLKAKVEKDNKTPKSFADIKKINNDPSLSTIKKVEKIDAFLTKGSPTPKDRKKAEGLKKKLSSVVKREKLAKKEKDDEVKYRTQRNEQKQDIIKGSTVQLMEPLLYRSIDYSYNHKNNPTQGFKKRTLVYPTYTPKTVTQPLYLSLGTAWNTIERLVQQSYPNDFSKICSDQKQCEVATLNFLLSSRVAKPMMAKAGIFNPASVAALLKQTRIKPQTPFLGTTAQEVYNVYKPTIENLILVWSAIDKVGVKKTLTAYRKALKKNDHMLAFYNSFATRHDIFKKSKQTQGQSWGVNTPLGFWMRRLHDGSAKVILTWLKNTLTPFDAELAKKIHVP